MAADVVAAWIAAAASLGSAGTAWFAQRSAARTAAGADRVAAIISARTNVSTNDKTIYVERITAERATWRSEMREHASRLVALIHAGTSHHDAELRYRASNIALRLNPAGFGPDPVRRDEHPLDRDIHGALAGINLEQLVARLLKQVWEDSKKEASLTPLS